MSALVKLTKMVDLAVGSPEPGAVNFNILHSLLHVIIQQAQLQNTEVEFRGDDAYRVQAFLDAAPPFPSLKLSEYTVLGEKPGSAHPSRPPTTNKKRDERSRPDDRPPRPEKIERKDSEVKEQLMTVVDHHSDKPPREQEAQDKKKLGSRKSAQTLVLGTKSASSVLYLEEQVEAKHKKDDRGRDDRKPRDKEESPRDKEERPRDKGERPRDKEERPRDKEDRPRDREERPRDKEERPKDREERPRDKQDRPRDKEDRPRDREERPRDKEDRPRDREDRPKEREEKARDKADRPRDREERPRDKEDRPRDREERPRDKEDRPREREERSRDREERPKDSKRDDGRRQDDRGKPARTGDDDDRRKTIVLVEHYSEEELVEKEKPVLKMLPSHHFLEKTKSSILKRTTSVMANRSTSYQKLLQTVSELQTEVSMLAEFHMPTNNELMDSVRSKSMIAPIGEMWELIKLTKRMDGAETGINKLATMIEDLAGENKADRETAGSVTKLTADGEDRSERIKSLEKRLWEIENRMGTAERRLTNEQITPPGTKDGSLKRGGGSQSSSIHGKGSPRGSGSTAPGASADGVSPEKSGKKKSPKPPKDHSPHIKGGGIQPSVSSDAVSQAPSGSITRGGRGTTSLIEHRPPIILEGLSTEERFETIRDEINYLRRDLEDQTHTIKGVTKIADRLAAGPVMSESELRSVVGQMLGVEVESVGHMKPLGRIDELEERVNTSALQIHSIDQNVSNQVESLQKQVNDMEKELGTILERLNSGKPSGESANQDFSGLGELYNKMNSLQMEIDNVTGTATRLMDEREERQLHINALLEQIEVLKTVKADKEDLEDALADKADHTVMNRKVSHDQFDAACDDLSRGLEEALAKLTQQEMLWQQALDDVQREVENKLDKIEISPLKDFVNSKLKLLQQRLKALAELRKQTEAAGTKTRLLKNVNCISCDKDAVMNMDETDHVASQPLPPTRSMRPYLTYELDAVRKQQRRLPGSRNMNHFESTVQDQQRKNRDKSRDRKRHMETTSADHLCNRYCGGSHTITTPQQRVTRMGHFLAEYGPEAIPLRQAQRPRALSIADKMNNMTKGMLAQRLMMANLGSSIGGASTESKSPRGTIVRPGSTSSVDVIKPPKRASIESKTGSVRSAKPLTPVKGMTPPQEGTPPKEATPPREGTPPTDEAPPPADDGGVVDEEAPPPEPTEEAEEGAAPPEEGDAPPAVDEDQVSVVEDAVSLIAEPPAEVTEGEAEPEPEAEAAPEAAPEPAPEPVPEEPEATEEPPTEE